MADRIESETGRSIEDWVRVADGAGLTGFMDIVAWLKSNHDFGHFQARLIAEEHRDR